MNMTRRLYPSYLDLLPYIKRHEGVTASQLREMLGYNAREALERLEREGKVRVEYENPGFRRRKVKKYYARGGVR